MLTRVNDVSSRSADDLAVWSADTGKKSAKKIENSLGMKFVRVPSGEFMMGSDESPEVLARLIRNTVASVSWN